jgi:3-methyl-2-oxobutanoate hydroxymethyltransferase
MLTAYDFTGAALGDKAEIDVILVGDSLGMVVLGYDSTVPVTMAEMLHHCRAVARGTQYAFTVGDMPFLSYQADPAEAVRNAGLLLKEGRMDSVKLEGGREVVSTIEAIIRAGIPVMGHIGLTPQSQSKLGGYRVQGKTAVSAFSLLQDALALEAAGCFSIVLEAIPDRVAKLITARLRIPTIGIGAGPDCDAQVLVMHDMLGLFDRFVPKFVKQYANIREQMLAALQQYRLEVETGRFPGPEHVYPIKDEVLERLNR